MTPGQSAHQQFCYECERLGTHFSLKLWDQLSDAARAGWERIAQAAVNAYAEPLVPETVPPRPDLRGASLRDASLPDADLRDASLSGLRSFKADLFLVLAHAQAEVPGLLTALRAGKINGKVYEGNCACLVGTIAKVRHCDIHALKDIKPDCDTPAEIWFYNINEGDTPETSNVAKITEGWLVEWLVAHGVNPDAQAETVPA